MSETVVIFQNEKGELERIGEGWRFTLNGDPCCMLIDPNERTSRAWLCAALERAVAARDRQPGEAWESYAKSAAKEASRQRDVNDRLRELHAGHVRELEGMIADIGSRLNALRHPAPAPAAGQTTCRTCDQIAGGFGPSHDGRPNCESGSIASGGTHAHCTCDTCF